jgi:hypothetical protein
MKLVICSSVFEQADALFPGFSELIWNSDSPLEQDTLDKLVESRQQRPAEWVAALEESLDTMTDIIYALVEQEQFEAAGIACKIGMGLKRDLNLMQKIVPINDLEA